MERRNFIRGSLITRAGLAATSGFPFGLKELNHEEQSLIARYYPELI